MDKKRRIAQSGDAAFSGSGKLSDFKKDGSWMMNQIEKGFDKVQRGVTIDKSTGNIVFSNVHKRQNKSGNGSIFSNVHQSNGDVKKSVLVQETAKRIAAKMIKSSEDYKIVKYYRVLQTNEEGVTVALKYCLYGQLDGSSIEDLALVKEFLHQRNNSDFRNLNSYFNIKVQYCGDACIDFKKNCVRLQFIMDVETDVEELEQALTMDCFDFISANMWEEF